MIILGFNYSIIGDIMFTILVIAAICVFYVVPLVSCLVINSYMPFNLQTRIVFPGYFVPIWNILIVFAGMYLLGLYDGYKECGRAI